VWTTELQKEVILVKRFKFVSLVVALVLFIAVPSFAAPVPSKTAPDQSIASRDADLALVRNVVGQDEVVRALAAQGFTQDQINSRVAQLSQQDLHQLAQNLNEVQAAGLTKAQWFWVGVGALAAVIIIVALN
jgi:hypothetical protein